MVKEEDSKKEVVKLSLNIEKSLYEKLEKKAKSQYYSSIEEYVYEIIRRNVSRKKVPGKLLSDIKRAGNLFTSKKVLSFKGGKPFPMK